MSPSPRARARALDVTFASPVINLDVSLWRVCFSEPNGSPLSRAGALASAFDNCGVYQEAGLLAALGLMPIASFLNVFQFITSCVRARARGAITRARAQRQSPCPPAGARVLRGLLRLRLCVL